MKCQWNEFLNLLPVWMRQAVDEQGRLTLQELRLRRNSPIQLIKSNGIDWLPQNASAEDISFCLNTATKYSPWTSSSIKKGYIACPGGHRIGLCGECIMEGDLIKNITTTTSMCIRIARDIEGVSRNFSAKDRSVLIIGRPGSGKTTFLRDLIRNISNTHDGSVTVVDERRELFPYCAGRFYFEKGMQTDVLSGCGKKQGIEMALRTMGPAYIAVDEITASQDCDALFNAAWCGVRLLATAHAENIHDLMSRKLYEPLVKQGIFQTVIAILPDKSWKEEVL